MISSTSSHALRYDIPSDRAAAAAEIDEWRREIDRIFSGGTPQRADSADLESAIERFSLSRQPFDDLIDAGAALVSRA